MVARGYAPVSAARPHAVERLPLSLRLSYGAPNFGLALVGIPILIYLPRFYSDVVGIPVLWIGAAFVLGRVLDALTDPLVGFLSDRSRSSSGRRHPWIRWGCLPLALLSFAVYMPPAALHDESMLVFAGLVIAGWFFAYTAVNVPYRALGPELSDDYDERTSLFAVREGLLVLGTLVAAAGPGVVSWVLGLGDGTEDERRRFAGYIMVAAPVLVLTCLWCTARVKERFHLQAGPQPPPGAAWQQVRQAFRNRPFVILLTAFVVIALGSSLPNVLISYFARYVLHAEELVPVFVVVYLLVGLACMPLWVALSKRKGKKPTWLAAMTINAGFFAGVSLVGDGQTLLYGLLVAGSGIGGVAALVLPYSMQADVIDHDELLTGERREGLYGGLWSIAEKTAGGLGLGLSMLVLHWAGYQPNAEQSEQVLQVLRGLYVGVPCVCIAAGFVIALRYPLDREAHQEIAQKLRRG